MKFPGNLWSASELTVEIYTHGQADNMNNVMSVLALCFLGSTNNQTNHRLTQLTFCIVVGYVCGPGWLSRYSESLRAGQSGDPILVGARISATVQTGPEVLSLLYNSYQFFTGGKAAGAWCWPRACIWLRDQRRNRDVFPLFPSLWTFVASSTVNYTFLGNLNIVFLWIIISFSMKIRKIK